MRARFLLPLLALTIMALAWPLAARARQALLTYTPDGRPFLFFDIYDKGELYGSAKYDNPGERSAWTFTAPELQTLKWAAGYWSDLVGPGAVNTEARRVIVGTYTISNAEASSKSVKSGAYAGMNELEAGLVHNWREKGDSAQIIAGWLQGAPHQDYMARLETLPHGGQTADLASILAHEIGHAMGLGSTANFDFKRQDFFFGEVLNPWDKHLLDYEGKSPTPGMAVSDASSPTEFYVSPDDTKLISFNGPHVQEVIRGAILGDSGNPNNNPGVPINAAESNADFGGLIPELSHIELRNSMMSHQNFRNYAGYMEAELAILQDVGYNLDRRNFYGHSVYGDHLTVNNTNGYFARNAAGTGYRKGVYNPTAMGVGLHIYGRFNDVTQSADILSNGYGGAGIRVDGWGNTLRIAPGVKAHSDGERGTGLMLAYGKEQTVVHRGDLSAVGKGGVGARFDFGSNMLGNSTEYRGSYIRTGDNQNVTLLPELQGPLVERFDVTGRIAGAAAAIYISESAWVKEINLMRGASLTGDIISRWNPGAAFVQAPGNPKAMMTKINFGIMPNAKGESDGALVIADPNFAMRYSGNITGSKSLDARVVGGVLAYKGRMDLNAFNLYSDAAFNPVIGDSPNVISAKTVDLQPGSKVGVATDRFSYGSQLGAESTVLKLEASNNLNNKSALQNSSGEFSMGAYDYRYSNPRWVGNNLVVDTPGRYSPELGGSSAATAATHIAASNPLRGQIGSRFEGAFSALERDYYAPSAGERDSARALWLTPGFGYVKHDGGVSYNMRTPSWALGYERLGESSFLGAALGMSLPYYRSDDADIDAVGFSAAVYGGTALPYDLELGGYAGYGLTSNDQTRKVRGEKYGSDYTSRDFFLGASLAKPIDLGSSWTMRPFAAYEFMHLALPSYAEKPGTYALSFEASNNALHKVEAGLGLSREFEGGSAYGRAYYAGVYGSGAKARTEAAFVMDPARNAFTSVGSAIDRDSFGFDLGAKVKLADSWDMALDYGLMIGQDSQSHQGLLSFDYKF